MFSGHLHIFNSKQIEGVNFIISGGAGDGVLDAGPNHYIRVHVSPDEVSISKIDI